MKGNTIAMDTNIKETIERLKSIPNRSMCASDVARAFMGKPITFFRDVCEFRDALVDTLSQCDPDEWSDEFLAANGLMRLHKDADGEYVHVDDEMVDSCGVVFTVNGIGGNTLYYYDEVTDTVEWTRAANKRHYKPDTWEKIIEDAIRGDGGYGCLEERLDAMVPALVKRCEALAASSGGER